LPWIRVIHEDEAEGKLKEVYDEITSSRGKVGNILKIHSLNPEALRAHVDLYMSIMFKAGNLSREQRELIATVVSINNNCRYCTQHHAQALDFYWKDPEKIQTLISDPTQIVHSEKDRAMLDYAVKLTKNPSSVSEQDVEILKEQGFTDENILGINLVTSYFNFVNRVAEGLGVEFSDDEVSGYKY
jgi:uncharacterized peroxidase-related enzyme